VSWPDLALLYQAAMWLSLRFTNWPPSSSLAFWAADKPAPERGRVQPDLVAINATTNEVPAKKDASYADLLEEVLRAKGDARRVRARETLTRTAGFCVFWYAAIWPGPGIPL
jgi:hypothetical protein